MCGNITTIEFGDPKSQILHTIAFVSLRNRMCGTGYWVTKFLAPSFLLRKKITGHASVTHFCSENNLNNKLVGV